jgi:glyoxylase-like metal-dependent hydrolase (beta-lactamase superfamily II)
LETTVTENVMKIGNVEVMALVDCEAKAPCSALFPSITADAWQPYREFLTDDCMHMQMTIPTFIVKAGGKTILIDSGVGAKDRGWLPNGRLPDVLKEINVRPDDIDIVMATHIHIDHVGWHTTADGAGWRPTFPNARHIFAKDEFDYFTQPEVANSPQVPWVNDCVLPLVDKVTIELVDSEQKITDEIVLIPTPGHTPAHSAIAITSGGESAVIIGDVCHHPAQMMETSWSPIFDLNPVLAAESREKLMLRIERDQMRVIAGHFAHPGFGRLVRVDGKRTWVPGL